MAVKIWRERDERLRYLGKAGKIISFTKILESPQGFEDQPYYVVMVEVNDKRVVGQWVSGKRPEMGMKVKGVLRKSGIAEKAAVIEYGVKWKKI